MSVPRLPLDPLRPTPPNPAPAANHPPQTPAPSPIIDDENLERQANSPGDESEAADPTLAFDVPRLIPELLVTTWMARLSG